GGMEFLETWLVERKTAAGQSALVVSHDRRFLNAVADRIVEVAHGRLEEYPGDYEAYRRLKGERERLRAKKALEQQKMIERTEEFIRRNIAGQKTKQAQGRRKMLARIERLEAPRDDANDVTFRFEEARKSGERVLEAKKIVPGYEETGPLLAPVSFLLRRGERVALWGPNGCGKTTLLKTIARVLPARGGSVAYGTGVLTGYYDQEMTDLPSGCTVLSAVMDLDPTMKEGEARDFLALFDFRGDDVLQKVATLSGGEKGRLSLARIVFGGANLLLLDEPTNHLDLDAREQLEDALIDFEGAIIFVSHDRWFIDRLATHLLEIDDGVAELHPGNYSALLRRRQEARAASPAAGAATPKAGRGETAKNPTSPVAAPRPDRVAERRKAKNVRRLQELEDEVAAMEESGRNLELAMADPEIYRDVEKARATKLQYQDLKEKIRERVSQWEEASRKLEEEILA
ncbi:MAG: ABC-F family ATP-binding cassette domain-containing protein, partial [Thermoanaerobaculia bacterium]